MRILSFFLQKEKLTNVTGEQRRYLIGVEGIVEILYEKTSAGMLLVTKKNAVVFTREDENFRSWFGKKRLDVMIDDDERTREKMQKQSRVGD